MVVGGREERGAGRRSNQLENNICLAPGKKNRTEQQQICQDTRNTVREGCPTVTWG